MNVGELIAWQAGAATVAILGGLAYAFGRYYWSRDAVILRARRREQRKRERGERNRRRLRELEEREVHRRNARGLPVGQWTVDNAPELRVQSRPPDAPPR